MRKRLNFYWRTVATGVGFISFAFGVLLLSLFFFVIVRIIPASQTSKHQWLLSCTRQLASIFLLLLSWLGLMSTQWQGSSLSQVRGNIIIANHPSLLDALFILARAHNLCCVVKEPLLRNPITAYLVNLAGFISNSSPDLLDQAVAVLAEGKNLLIFPEGTRNTELNQLQFKRGASNIALVANCPITPVYLLLKPRTLQKGDHWYDIPTEKILAKVATFPEIHPRDLVDIDRPISIQARQLTKNLTEFYAQQASAFDDGFME